MPSPHVMLGFPLQCPGGREMGVPLPHTYHPGSPKGLKVCPAAPSNTFLGYFAQEPWHAPQCSPPSQHIAQPGCPVGLITSPPSLLPRARGLQPQCSQWGSGTHMAPLCGREWRMGNQAPPGSEDHQFRAIHPR